MLGTVLFVGSKIYFSFMICNEMIELLCKANETSILAKYNLYLGKLVEN